MIPVAAVALATAALLRVADPGTACPPTDLRASPSGASGAADTGRAVWQATVGYGFEDFTSSWATWQTTTVRLERKTATTSIAAVALLTTRFGLTDRGGALDSYRTLWRKAYAHLQLGVAPGARVTPRVEVAAEMYQGLPSAWEVSASYRRMDYPGSGVNLWGGSLAKYLGNWYVIAHLTAVPQAGKLGGGISLQVRRYFATADDYLDLSGGTGSEVVTLAADQVAVEASRFVAVRLQRYVSEQVGFSIGATYNTQQGIPSRRGLNAAAMYRW